jgi:hypothetical protein
MKHINRRQAIVRAGMSMAGLALANWPDRALAALPSPGQKRRSDWMIGKWGMMVHWIAPGPQPEHGPRITDLNRAVNAFNLEGFLEQFEASGADFLMFTIGQNTSYYASPNATLDRLAGSGHCSERDLILEIAKGVQKQQKHFITYLPAEVQQPKSLHAAFAWNSGGDQTEFEHRYTTFIREYSERYAGAVDGWWFDGCYTWPDFPNKIRHWPLWLNAARAGNPEAVVAFNDGAFYSGITRPVTPLEDYFSGECWGFRDGKIMVGHGENTSLTMPSGRFVEGTECQFHVQTPIDCNGNWWHENPGSMPPPKYADEDLFPVVRNCLQTGGTVTLNVGIYQEGNISTATLSQLKRLNTSLNRS